MTHTKLMLGFKKIMPMNSVQWQTQLWEDHQDERTDGNNGLCEDFDVPAIIWQHYG